MSRPPGATVGWRQIRGEGAGSLQPDGEVADDRAADPLDVNVPDRRRSCCVLELGGHLVETKSHRIGEFEESWTVMRDPEGTWFLHQSPEDAPHRYIGNVTFACGTRGWAGSGRMPSAGRREIDEVFAAAPRCRRGRPRAQRLP
jgi:hypothetical protein